MMPMNYHARSIGAALSLAPPRQDIKVDVVYRTHITFAGGRGTRPSLCQRRRGYDSDQYCQIRLVWVLYDFQPMVLRELFKDLSLQPAAEALGRQSWSDRDADAVQVF